YHTFLPHATFTDAEFGYDGKLYVSDFVGLDWGGASKGGRIYTVYDPAKIQSSVVQETKKLFAEGVKQRSDDELAALLEHPDMRVRLRAQWTIAARGANSVPVFRTVLDKSKNQLARLHAVWGLGQLKARGELERALGYSDPEIQAQAAKTLGD